MLGDHVALLENRRRRRQRLSSGERPGLRKNPRIANRTPGGCHAIDPCLANHVETSLRREQIAASQNNAVAGVPLHFAEKLPAAWADILLLDRAAVDRDRRHAALEG